MSVKAHPLYATWVNMRQRCNNPRNPMYPHYGGRGIRVCSRWNDFHQFVRDVGSRPDPEMTLDRMDNDRGYEPMNVRWATPVQQANNRSDNRHLRAGETDKTMANWGRQAGVEADTIHFRLKSGVPVEHSISAKPLPGLHWKRRISRPVVLDGVEESLSRVAKRFAISKTTLLRRLRKGVSLDEAVQTPVRAKAPNGQAKRRR